MANRDWCDLPLDIVRLICKKLPDIYDFVVFRAVCKTWWSCECDPPLQLPWIVEHRIYPDDPTLQYYSISSGKMITISCERSCKKCFVGPSYHYLLAYRPTKSGFLWSLLNPLTNNEIPLPPLEEDLMYWIEWIGPNPAGSGESVILSKCGITSSDSRMMNLCQSEDHDSTVEFAIQGMNGNGRLYHKGEFFAVDVFTGVTKVTDITTQKLVYELPPLERSQYYWKFWMVESGGEILLLRKMSGIDQIYFDIYRLDLKKGKGNASWVEVDGIVEQVLFLDEHRGLSFSSKDYKGLGENCIYLLEDDSLYKYDIKDGTVENLYCPFVGCDKTWFTPCPY